MNKCHPSRKCFILFLWFAACACLISPVAGLAGETVTLKNGKTLTGSIAAWSGDRTMIYFQPDDPSQELQWIPLSEIERLQFGAVVFNQTPPGQTGGRRKK